MSLIALVGGTALYMFVRDRLNAAERSPLIGRLKGRRTFEAVLGAIVDAARGLHGLLGTRRLQVQLRLLIATGLLVGTLPFLPLGYIRGPLVDTPIAPVFAILWLIRSACATPAAWQSQCHRQVDPVRIRT